jgi:hypothetical protein
LRDYGSFPKQYFHLQSDINLLSNNLLDKGTMVANFFGLGKYLGKNSSALYQKMHAPKEDERSDIMLGREY